jgi:hypothetical protein
VSRVKYITPSSSPSQPPSFLSFPAFTSTIYLSPLHHDGLVRVRVSFFFHSPSDPPSPPSFAFSSSLADPCSWPTPSPLDSTDPLDVFDPILYPTFEREIVGFPSSLVACLLLDDLVNVSVLQLYLLRAQHPRPARVARSFRGNPRRVCAGPTPRADVLPSGRLAL